MAYKGALKGEIISRVRVVCIDEPDGYMVPWDTSGMLTNALFDLPKVTDVCESSGSHAYWMITFEDSDQSDDQLVDSCRRLVQKYLRRI